MSTSCVFSLVARIMCIGIALDNGINTLYYLNLDNWSNFSILTISIISALLNGLLYWQGADTALLETWQDLKNVKLNNCWPYFISIISAYVMATFTLHSYIETKINIPYALIYLFTICFFIGTHTLIIQACKRDLKKELLDLKTKQKMYFFICFIILMVGTVSAIPQWVSGVEWISNSSLFTNFTACIICIGEVLFVGQLSLWLCKGKLQKIKAPVVILIVTASALNALGFASMTEYDSFVTNLIHSSSTFTLGFILSFVTMIRSLYIWSNNLKPNRQKDQQLYHQT